MLRRGRLEVKELVGFEAKVEHHAYPLAVFVQPLVDSGRVWVLNTVAEFQKALAAKRRKIQPPA
jgi:hypothetical protein